MKDINNYAEFVAWHDEKWSKVYVVPTESDCLDIKLRWKSPNWNKVADHYENMYRTFDTYGTN